MTVCPKCKGYGIVGSAVPDILRGRGAIFSSNECDMCHGSGEVPMTNEEWIRQCDTEQLAEAIYYLTWFHTELDERLDKNVKNGCYNDDENIKIVMEWLKQPHQ